METEVEGEGDAELQQLVESRWNRRPREVRQDRA